MRRELYADDCLDVLDPISGDIAPNSVDLVYLDPPFNTNRKYNLPFGDQYKTGKAYAAFKDTWTWGDAEDRYYEQLSSRPQTRLFVEIVDLAKKTHPVPRGRKPDMSAYLVNMAIRLNTIKLVLKETGSIYLHCDRQANFYLRLLMDAIFGKQNFLNEIIWAYKSGGVSRRWFGNKHDTILFYAKNINKHRINLPKEKSYTKSLPEPHTNSGKRLSVLRDDVCDLCEKGYPGQKYRWVTMRDVWTDIRSIFRNDIERLGYPTQKPERLLERIIETSSNPGDVVLDPFCGCGTTIVAAEELKRQWIGIDISHFAVGLMQKRVLVKSILISLHVIFLLVKCP